MHCAADGPFNSTQRRHKPHCLLDTHVDPLQEIHNWADGQDERIIFWLNGLAGTGKATVTCTIARRYFDQKCPGVNFLLARTAEMSAMRVRSSRAWRGSWQAAYLLSAKHIRDALTERRDIAS